MKEISPETEKRSADGAASQETGKALNGEELVRLIGLNFSNTFLYGPDHIVTKKAIDDSFGVLSRALESCEEISFNITDAGLMVNDNPVEQKNPLIRMFVAHLTSLEISNFSLTRGMSHEKFKHLIEILNTKPEELKKLGGFSAVVSSRGLENVHTRTVTYKQITEDEVVVAKEKLEKAGVKGEGGNVEGIVAFLKGDVSAGDENTLKSMKETASDAQKLGELIMRAAEVRKESVELEDGESFANLVVGCLGRAYEGLVKDPSIKTQKGKKNLTKTLLLLEKQILERMREISGGLDDDTATVVSEAIEGMADGLKIETLAVEYMKKRNAIETSEKRILRFIKTKGLDRIDGTDLQEKLVEGGLTPEGWQELIVKSDVSKGMGPGLGVGLGAGAGAGPVAGGGIGAIGHLALLLTQIEKEAEKGTKPGGVTAEKLTGVLTEVGQEVNNIVAGAEQKIENLVKDIKTDEEMVEAVEKRAKKEGKGPKVSRKKLLELLAEIVQELCQPLAVINCSIEMISSKNLGAVTDQQVDMLDLATSSGERLKQLIDRLMEISGVPTTLAPDAVVQASLYK